MTVYPEYMEYPEPKAKCASCGEDLYSWEEVIELDGDYICDEYFCLFEYMKKNFEARKVEVGAIAS